MKKIQYLLRFSFFLVLSFLLGFSHMFMGQISDFTIQSHSLILKVWPLLLVSMLFFILLLGIWIGYSRVTAYCFKSDFARALDTDFFNYLPLLYLILLPFLLSHYLDSDDLRLRSQILIGSILFSLLYLKAVSLCKFGGEAQPLLADIRKKLSLISFNKKLLILFMISLLLYNAGSMLLTSSGQTFAGDEPHYLLITHSLLKDGDFNLANNYANRDYTNVMLAQVHIQSHTAPGTEGRYSFHSPGTSLLLLPFYALGSLFGGQFLVFFIRFGMSIFGALLGLQVFLYIFQEWKNERLALGVWFLYSFSSPIFFYSLHVYPEIIIALFSLTVFRLLRFSPSFSRKTLLILGFLLSCFVWFHAIKYIFLLIPLFIYSLWTLLKNHKIGWRILYFLTFPLVLTIIYFLFQSILYGSLSLSSVSWRGALTPQESLSYLKVIIFDIPFRTRWETLAGYFLDQRDGLLLYAPIYFFAFLGGVEMLRRNFRFLLLILFLSAPYVLNSAFLTQRTGYAPQARPLISVSWVLAILIGFFLVYNAKKIFSIVFHLFAFSGLCFVFLLLKNPSALYQLTTVGSIERAGRLFLILSNLHFSLPQYLPSFLKIDNSGWIPNNAWIGSLFLFIALYIAIKKHDFRMKLPSHLFMTSMGLLVVFFWLVLYPRTVLLYPTHTTFPSGQKITFYSLGRVAQMVEPGKFHLPRDNRSYVFHFTSWRDIREFSIDFGSIEGTFDVNLRFFDYELYKGDTIPMVRTLHLPAPSSYRLKNTNLYRISIYLKRTSGVVSFSKPFLFAIRPLN